MTCTCRDDFDEIIHKKIIPQNIAVLSFSFFNPTTLIEIAVYNNKEVEETERSGKFKNSLILYKPIYLSNGR